MAGAADGAAGVGLGQRHHAVGAPLLLALAEVLAQRGEHAHLQPQRAGGGLQGAPAAAGAHVDEVIQRGVVGPGAGDTGEGRGETTGGRGRWGPPPPCKLLARTHSGDRKKVYFLWSRSAPLVVPSQIRFCSVQLNWLGSGCEWR